MRFLIDENLPHHMGDVFAKLGFLVEHVRDIQKLRGQTDEVIFKYAAANKNIIVTRDVNFANPLRFELTKLPGIVTLRFPNEISMSAVCREVEKISSTMKNTDWHNIVILEPGSIRLRKL